MRPADLGSLHALDTPTVSPDGRFAVVSVVRPDLAADDYRGGLWIVPTDGSAPARPLTHGWRDTAPAYSPDGAWLAFLRAGEKDSPGPFPQVPGSKPQIYVMPTGGGEPSRVTAHPLGAGPPAWSPDSRRIAYTARVPDEGRYGDGKPEAEAPRRITTLRYREDNVGFLIDRRAHVFIADPIAAPAAGPVQVTGGDFDHSSVAWSADGRLLAFVSARHDGRDTDSVRDVWVCEPDGSAVCALTPGRAGGLALRADQVVFSADGASVYFTATDVGPDGNDVLGRNTGLWMVPADASARPRRITDTETIHLAGGLLRATSDGILAAASDRGAIRLLLVPYDGGEPTTVLGGARQVNGAAQAGSVLVASVADPASAGELVAVTDGTERTVTSFAAIGDPAPMTELTATAPDGYPVHGWVVRPSGPGPHPVLLMIHGGPFTQYGWRLFDEAQVYAGAGYAVVMGNPRGSAGYGQAHGRAIIGDAARIAAGDLIALLDAALAGGGLDGSRVGVLGGSYGGYMTTWLAAHHGDRFKAAVSERAVNAVDSFHGSSDIGWFFADCLYGADPAGWVAQSPLTFASQIEIPMLIVHSEHDWRCPIEQAQRLFVALKLRGVPAEMLIFPGEGHELSRSGLPSHRVARFEAIVDWWSRHLS